MDYKVKPLAKSEVEITVAIPEEGMNEYKEKACALISKDMKIKGFRPGKAPYSVLIEHIGKEYVDEEVKRIAVQMTYADIVIKEKINVITRPNVDIKETKEGEGISYTAKVAVLPEVTLKDHKSVKVKAESTEPSEKDVNAVIEQLLRLHQVPTEIDGPAKKGHRVEIDFEGFDEGGAALDNTKSKNHPIVIGDNTMVPGFEDALVGLKKGEKKEFEVTFPKDYHYKPFQNKKVIFKVECKMVEEMNTPELNEELVEKITAGEKKDVKGFKEDVKKNLEMRKMDEEKARQEGALIEEFIKKAKIELPESLIEDEISHMLAEFKHELEHSKKIPFEQFLEQNKKTEDDLRKEYKPEAEKRIKARLVLNKVLEEDKIDVSDKELDDEINKIIETYPKKEQYKAKKELKKKDLRNRFRNKLKLDKLFKQYLPAYGAK